MSAAATSFISCRPLQSLHLPTLIRSHSSSIPMIRRAAKYLSSNRQHQHLFRINRHGVASRHINMKINANSLPPVPSAPSGPSLPGWTGWVLLAIVPILIPFFTGGGKLGSFKVFKNKVDSALAKVATIAEQIEDAAEAVDKIADEVVEHLPEGSKLRNIVEKLDDIAEKTIKGADLAGDILEMVDDVGDSVEAMLEASSKVAADTKRLNSDMDQVAVAADKLESDMDQVRVAISQVYDEKKEMSKDQAAGTTTVSAKEKNEY